VNQRSWIVMLAVWALLAAGGCRRVAPGPEVRVAENPQLHLLAFECAAGGAHLAIYDLQRDVVELYGPDGHRTLPHLIAASGARYGDDQCVLWTKGQTISYELDGSALPDCAVSGRQAVLEAAFQAGFRFRASGNEPGWVLLAGPRAVEVQLPHVPTSVRFPGLAAGELEAPGALHRRTDAHTLEITVRDLACFDSMSGEPSPVSVDLVLDGHTYRGCGLWLR
jgi:uncharacterized membrane protein